MVHLQSVHIVFLFPHPVPKWMWFLHLFLVIHLQNLQCIFFFMLLFEFQRRTEVLTFLCNNTMTNIPLTVVEVYFSLFISPFRSYSKKKTKQPTLFLTLLSGIVNERLLSDYLRHIFPSANQATVPPSLRLSACLFVCLFVRLFVRLSAWWLGSFLLLQNNTNKCNQTIQSLFRTGRTCKLLLLLNHTARPGSGFEPITSLLK